MYSSIISSISALDGDGWLTLRPCRFTPEKETQYQLYRRLNAHEIQLKTATTKYLEGVKILGYAYPII
jgi:hypothetical protein